MAEDEIYLRVKCENKKCFSDTSKPLNCSYCDEGKLYIQCFNCGKENLVKGSTMRRIDCECRAGMVPCGITRYKLENLV